MIRRISVDDLEPGMVVAKLQSDIWLHLPQLYTEPGPVRDLEHLRSIREAGFREVFVEAEVPTAIAVGASDGDVPIPVGGEADDEPLADLGQELEVAREVYDRALSLAHELVHQVTETGLVDCDASRRAVGTVIASVSRNAAALICLANLRHHDDYTYTHCVDVAALAVVYGRYLGIGGEDLVELGLAGLFHDLGKTRVDPAIIVKPGKLSEAEFAVMKRHPALGKRILERQEGVSPRVVRAVAEHHERFNGQGYPAGLHYGEISLYGRILALADVFDALTSDRSYRAALPADKALSLMFAMRDRQFSSPDLQRFVKCLGIYPVGSLVRLSDGRLAVVCRHRPHLLLQPVVNVVTDAVGEDQDPVRLDLADPPEPGREPLRIEEGISPRDVGVNVARWLR